MGDFGSKPARSGQTPTKVQSSGRTPEVAALPDDLGWFADPCVDRVVVNQCGPLIVVMFPASIAGGGFGRHDRRGVPEPNNFMSVVWNTILASAVHTAGETTKENHV